MEISRLKWKLFFTKNSKVDPDKWFEFFNTWITDNEETFIDVADYKHVQDGPLVALVGHYADCFLDDSNQEYGFVFTYKRNGLCGSLAERFRQSFYRTVFRAQNILDSGFFGGDISFDLSRAQLIFNDRALTPNTSEIFEKIRPDLESMLNRLGENQSEIHFDQGDPRSRLSVNIMLKDFSSLSDIQSKLDK